jgi:hypothetical protein
MLGGVGGLGHGAEDIAWAVFETSLQATIFSAMPALPNHWALVNSLTDAAQASGDGLRANYTWSVIHAASIAARTGRERISVLEFGVAGGNGLVALERAAEAAEADLDVGIDVIGFDTGEGLPPPRDNRDAPFLMDGGDFPMEVDELRSRLDRAELVLGDVRETIPGFLAAPLAEIGFISFDLDYYSSTRDALAILAADPTHLMPRILCYFDDTHGYPWGDFNGARLAIEEYNGAPGPRKLAQIHGLRYLLPASEREVRWPEAMYVAHAFDHPAYAEAEGTELVRRLDLDPPTAEDA